MELKLESEIHAYKAGEIYSNKLKSMQLTPNYFKYDMYKFDDKVNLLKKMRYRIIRNERLKIKIKQAFDNLKQRFANFGMQLIG